MARSVSWRRICPDQVSRRIEQALEARFYILRETGPTGFLVKEDEHDKKLKVFLGDPNSCTCSTFMKERELCIHILWVLLRKFRIGKENPLVFQKALVEREIQEILQGHHIRKQESAKMTDVVLDGKEKLIAKNIDEDDVCPICQEELLDCKEPLTHCKFGCGNNIHIKCMKIWAQHRKSGGDNIVKCPLCRTDFGSYQDIIQEFHKISSRHRCKIETNDVHIGATCNQCKVSPIQGKCFRCVVCLDFHLCQECFRKKIHMQHSFQFRKNTNQRWRAALRNPDKTLPTGIVENLQNRDIGEEDYELLLQLDSRTNADTSAPVILPLTTLNSGSQEIKEHMQCQLCCEAFMISNHVRRLACMHSFHKDCIDEWISRGNLQCPFDRIRITGRMDVRQHGKKASEKTSSDSVQNVDLSVLGINSKSFLTRRQEREVKPSKAPRKHSRKSSFSSTNERIGDLSELYIHGAARSNDVRTHALSAPAVKNSRRVDNVIPPQAAHSSIAKLPPLHPNKSQPKRNSSNRLIQDQNVNRNDELKIGDFEGTSVRVRRANGSLTNKKRPSRTFTSISSSEPDLVLLSDAFRVSRINSVEGNGL